MNESVTWFSEIILNYPLFQYLIIFFGAAFGGELALFALGFLTAQGILGIPALIILSFLGGIFADVLWFTLGKTITAGKIISHRYARPTISLLIKAIERVSKGNRLVALIMAKFMIGTRIVLIMYASKSNLDLSKFVRYDSMAIVVWLIVVIPIGFVAGLGFSYLSDVFHNVYVAIGFILLVIFVLVIIQISVEKYLEKKSSLEIK